MDVRRWFNKKIKKYFEDAGRLKVTGLENLPASGPFIVACNHVGSLESILLPHIISKQTGQFPASLANEFVCRRFGKNISAQLNLIPVPKTDKARCLEPAIDQLKNHQAIIIIFPEGGRQRHAGQTRDYLLKGKTGLARLWLATGVPIIPVGYQGPSDNVFFTLMPIKHFLFSRQPASLDFGQALNLDQFAGRTPDKDLLTAITREIMLSISHLSGQKYEE